MKRITWMILAALLLSPALAQAHCDTLDGPVAKAAEEALARKQPERILVWVKADSDAELRAAYQKALNERAASPEAKKASDLKFIETAVRLHRAGEGEPFTGLKPAGQDPGAAVRTADEAIQTKSLRPVEKLLPADQRSGLDQKLAALGGKASPPLDLAKGRAWVEAYVSFVHEVEHRYHAVREGHGQGCSGEGAHGKGAASGAGGESERH